MKLRYGLDIDRDYLVDIVFSINSLLPFLFSITIYPAKFYLLKSHGPSMDRKIRAAYIINLISLVAFDWIFAVFVRLYTLPPYGLWYCEGILCTAGVSKRIIMGALGTAIMSDVVTFYALMMRMHQLTVSDPFSRWRLSQTAQRIIYVAVTITCSMNLIGFVVFTEDVENYDELVKEPELAWLAQRGGTLVLYGEPGKTSGFIIEYLLGMSFVSLFFPFFIFFCAHALIYLLKKGQSSKSSKTQVITRRLFITFSFQMLGATFFFLTPIGVIGTTSILDLSWILTDEMLAFIRFSSILALELNTTQTVVVFLVINVRHWKLAKISSAIRRPSTFLAADQGNTRRISVVPRFTNF